MFDIIKTSPWDDIWRTMDALIQYPLKEKTLETQGLKTLIRRPHNLINVKNDKGQVVAQRLEVVTTPFPKNCVKVQLINNVLTIECQYKENKNNGDLPLSGDSNDEYIYKGISSQEYRFSIKLSNNIDTDNIKAKNVDGVLTITLPFKQMSDSINEGQLIEVE